MRGVSKIYGLHRGYLFGNPALLPPKEAFPKQDESGGPSCSFSHGALLVMWETPIDLRIDKWGFPDFEAQYSGDVLLWGIFLSVETIVSNTTWLGEVTRHARNRSTNCKSPMGPS